MSFLGFGESTIANIGSHGLSGSPASNTCQYIPREAGQASSSAMLNPAETKVISKINALSLDTVPTRRDLWADAVQKLTAEEQQAVSSIWSAQGSAQAPTTLSEIMNDLLVRTRNLQIKCKAKGFKFQFRGKSIIMRDIAEKIIMWLNKFKEVGDIVVNFDPVHAALPWAGFRLLLQAATVEYEQMGCLILALEKIACLINRGAVYEELYYPGVVSPNVLENLEHSIVDLYSTMLRLVIACYRLFSKSTAKRTLHALFNPGEVQEFLENCEHLEQQVEHEAHNCERSRSQDTDKQAQKLLHILREPVLRTDENVLALLAQLEIVEQREILDWTSTVLYGDNHQFVSDQRTHGTCQWIFDQGSYTEWQDTSASSILWLWGTAGTGKTFVTSKVIDEIQASLTRNVNQEGFAFFYCNRNEMERRDPLSVLQAFVRQLSTIACDQHSIQKSFKQYVDRARLRASKLTMGNCKKLLLEFINTYPRTTLIVDALDECENEKRTELIEVLEYLVNEAANPLKVFISSRPDGDIKEKLKKRSNIAVNVTRNYDDISIFVNNEIIRHRRWSGMPSDLQALIVETLQEQSQGMFQWAYLQIKQLLELHQPAQIRDRLGKLPEDLKAAYNEIVNSIPVSHKEIAHRTFQWVMITHHPLTTQALLPAVCQDGNTDTLMPLDGLDEELLLEYCHNLLVIDPIRNVWVLSHLSVLEYFEKEHWSRTQANSLVLVVCLLVLQNTLLYNRQTDWLVPVSLRTGAFFSSTDAEPTSISRTEAQRSDPIHGQEFKYLSSYARKYWVFHANQSAEVSSKRPIRPLLEEFLGKPNDSSPAYRCWCEMLERDGFGHLQLASRLRPVVLFLDLKPPSIASFAFCRLGIAFLLPNWHNFHWVKDDFGNFYGDSFLEQGASSHDTQLCRDLIQHGAEVNARTNSTFGSALCTAVAHTDLAVVKLLLKEGGANVNMQVQCRRFGSALAVAVHRSEVEVIEYLIQQAGADVNMQLQYGRYGSALATAVSRRRVKVVAYVLRQAGADVNMQLQYGSYESGPAFGVTQEVIESLIKSGAEVNMQLQYGFIGSALAAAAFGGVREEVESLIESGAEVDMKLRYGFIGSALAAAAFAGKREVVEILIESGAEVDMKLRCGFVGSALAAAAFAGKWKVVEIFIESGAEANMQLQYGKYVNALSAAREGQRKNKQENKETGEHFMKGAFRGADHEVVIEILLKHGAVA